MKPTLQRAFVGTYLITVAVTLISGASLFVGIDMALDRGGEALWTEAFAALVDVAPSLCGPLLFIAAMMTIGRFHREGSLLSVAAAGLPLRVVGGWLLLASLPFAVAVQLAAVYGEGSGALPPSPPASSLSGGSLVDGGLLLRSRRDGGRLGPAVVLPAAGSRLLVGVEQPPPAAAPRRQVHLRVFEEWDLAEGVQAMVSLEQPWSWSGQLLSAPRALVWEDGADAVALKTLQRWIDEEPGRPDLAFARAVKLRAGLRLLVLLWIGCGFWLRPAPGGLAARNLAALGAALAYLALEAACAAPGAVGALPPNLAGFAPLALASLYAAWLCRTCDRPRT